MSTPPFKGGQGRDNAEIREGGLVVGLWCFVLLLAALILVAEAVFA